MDQPASPSDAADRLAAAVSRRFAVDLRALAAFRIALGVVLLLDLARRTRGLEAFYTDSGVLPREALFSDYSVVHSLHAASGEAWVQGLLFLVAGGFALALTVGYWTRAATVVSWLLLLSLHARNPMVLNSGDALLGLLLFWGIFLPLGERWSLDARGVDRDRSSVTTVATMALLLQTVLMYVTNAAHKLEGEMWLNGEAVVYVFQLDQFTILLGDVLAGHHALLRLFTYAWIALVVLSPLLIVLTGLRRAVLAALFVGMHLGMLLTMRLHLFPLIVVAGLVPFFPAVVWDAATGWASSIGATDAVRRSAARLETARSRVRVPAVPTLSGDSPYGRDLLSTVVPGFFLVLVVLSNAAALGYTEVPDSGESVLEATETDQNWRMFAPEPLTTTRWYVAPGELENGSTVDALHGSAVEWDRPPSVDETYPTSRWRKYLSNVRSADNENRRSYLGAYLCARWNDRHETDLVSVTIYAMEQPADPYEETAVRRYEMHEHDCSGDLLRSS